MHVTPVGKSNKPFINNPVKKIGYSCEKQVWMTKASLLADCMYISKEEASSWYSPLWNTGVHSRSRQEPKGGSGKESLLFLLKDPLYNFKFFLAARGEGSTAEGGPSCARSWTFCHVTNFKPLPIPPDSHWSYVTVWNLVSPNMPVFAFLLF